MVDLPGPGLLDHLREEGIRSLVSDHYDELLNSSIRHMFPADEQGLALAKQHAADFFIQLCGGPDYFKHNRGQPMMVKRHAPFKITPSARVVWLVCYRTVLARLDAPEEVLQPFWNYLNIFSAWMVNTAEGPEAQNV
jgi:hemoglobin